MLFFLRRANFLNQILPSNFYPAILAYKAGFKTGRHMYQLLKFTHTTILSGGGQKLKYIIAAIPE